MKRVKTVILRAVALVSKKTYFKPMLTFWPFYTIKHLYVPGPFGNKWTKMCLVKLFMAPESKMGFEYIVGKLIICGFRN